MSDGVRVPEYVTVCVIEDPFVDQCVIPKGDCRIVIMGAKRTGRLNDRVMTCTDSFLNEDGEWSLPSLDVDPSEVCAIIRHRLFYDGGWPVGHILFHGRRYEGEQFQQNLKLPEAVAMQPESGSLSLLFQMNH